MNPTIMRMLITGAFALIGLVGALVLEALGQGTPEWLIGVIGMATGFLFGHVWANGFNGKKNH